MPGKSSIPDRDKPESKQCQTELLELTTEVNARVEQAAWPAPHAKPMITSSWDVSNGHQSLVIDHKIRDPVGR
jgi:hypothetical protein